MDIVKVFGANVKKYRTRIGLSQEVFAEKCVIASFILPSTISFTEADAFLAGLKQ